LLISLLQRINFLQHQEKIISESIKDLTQSIDATQKKIKDKMKSIRENDIKIRQRWRNLPSHKNLERLQSSSIPLLELELKKQMEEKYPCTNSLL
jgi:uncharacterized membrane protein